MKLLLAPAAIAATFAVQAEAALITGDMMFSSFNADDNSFSLTTFVDVPPNTLVFFTDKEWNGLAVGVEGRFNASEGYTQWNSGDVLIAAGSVVLFGDSSADVLQSSQGNYTRPLMASNQGFEIASGNEVIYAHLGAVADVPTIFLSAITNGNFASAGTIANTDLQEGTTALDLNGPDLTSPDYGAYIGPRSGLYQFAEYKALVANRFNWQVDIANGDYADTPHNATAFTISSVPIPASVWLFFPVLMGLAGFIRRR